MGGTLAASRLERAAPPIVTVEASPHEWSRYVRSRPDASGYHDWEWRTIFARAFGHECIYLAARAHGQVAGVLPLVQMKSVLFGRFLVSLPFVNYGGIVADDPAAAAALLERATEIARQRRLTHIELRHTDQRFPELPSKRHKVAMLLSLVAADQMWDALDRKVRNQIRKAEKSGLTREVGRTELLDDFYRVFARNMRDLGTPVYSRRFFEEVLRAFPSRTEVHVVRKGPDPVAASLTFRTRNVTEVPWASSIREFNPLCPNHLLYWGMIQRASAVGCGVFDFGRSTPNEGTYKFKEQWGARPVPFCWEYALIGGGQLPDSSPHNPKFSTAIAAWKHLPLAVANRLGPAIVRSIP